MGMFDDIRCEMDLPGVSLEDPDFKDREFQTKSLDCTMSRYTITRDGRLIHHDTVYEPTPHDELPDPKRKWIGSVRPIKVDDRPIPYHGMIEFYGVRSFIATFAEGRCVGITESDRFNRGIVSQGTTIPEPFDAREPDEWSERMNGLMRDIYFDIRLMASVGKIQPDAFVTIRDKLITPQKAE